MTFSNPRWLAVGFIACLCLIWIWRRYDARQHAALAQFVSAHLRAQLTQSVSIGRRRLQRGLMLASLALLFVALAGPLLGYRWELISRRGNEIIFAVDTSRSMSTPDVRPDRLTRAKLAIDDFTNKLDGDAVGLVAFAGNAFLVCPITLDYGAFHESLNAIDVNTIPRGGTNIGSAVREAQAALRRRPGSDKILVLLTDGEDLEGDALVAARTAGRQDGLKIFTVGVGTPQGDLIPVTGSPDGGFVKDASGGFVKSRLDEPALKAIAAATGGLYAALGSQGEGLETIYRLGLGPALKHDLASRRQRVYTQRFQWPLAGSVGLLLLSLLVGSRRRVASRQRHQASDAGPSLVDPAAVSLLMLLLLSLAPPASVRASTARAEEAYKKGDFATAANEYAAAAKRDPKLPALHFNMGAAAYRAGQFPQAARAFQESISVPSGDSKRLAEQEDAYYNLGNTLYRTGQKIEESAPQQTLQAWNDAVKAYETALQLRRDDTDSRFNRDLVKRKIEELKQKRNQSQNNQQNQNQQNQSQQQNKQDQQQQNQAPNQPQKQPQSPQRQAPQNSPQQASVGAPPPDQQPPAPQPGQQPPPSADQLKPSNGQPKPADGNNEPQPDQSGSQRLPGQMTQEEARELLDSQKGEERHALGLPVARKEADTPPDRPARDW